MSTINRPVPVIKSKDKNTLPVNNRKSVRSSITEDILSKDTRDEFLITALEGINLVTVVEFV